MKWSSCGFLILLLIITTQLSPAAAQDEQGMVYTYRAAESEKDNRYNYDTALLRLALDNTVATDGPYQLIASPVMTFTRAKEAVESNRYPNFFIKLSYEKEYEEMGMAYVPFPVDRGIVGYRVCFVAPEVKEQVEEASTLDELKKFLHGQGRGWSDTDILRHNGFRVREVTKYESLFEMVARGRFDLFCRGTNELLGEIETHYHLSRLSYDISMSLVYPLPRFFYTNKENKKGLDRVTKGIMIAYRNGSLQKIWRKEYQKSINLADLKKRKLYRLENPFVESIPFDYEQFFFDPLVD